MGQCARRLAVLAGLLAPSGAYAQLAPVGVPAGVLRVDLDGSVETWDHRWLDGERAPLGTDLSSPAAGSDLLPSLIDADARIGRITGLTGYRLNLGALTTDALADESRGSLGLALGLTRAITIFGNVPLVRVRVQTRYALTPTTTTDAGLTPGTDAQASFFGQFDASLATLGQRLADGDFDGDPALKARAATTLQDATALRDDLFGLLADPLTASSFVPTATSTAGTAVTTRLTTLQTTLASDFGVAGFSELPTLPTEPAATADLLAALGDPSGPTALQLDESKLTFRGDAEAGVALTLVDRWDRGRGRGGFRAAVEGLVRFPTGELARPDRVLALGTGDGQTDVEFRITADLGAGRWGLRGEGMYNRQLAADYILRVAPPTQPLAGLDLLSARAARSGRRGADRGAAVLPAGADIRDRGHGDALVARRGRGLLPDARRRDSGRRRVGARAGHQGQRDGAGHRDHVQQCREISRGRSGDAGGCELGVRAHRADVGGDRAGPAYVSGEVSGVLWDFLGGRGGQAVRRSGGQAVRRSGGQAVSGARDQRSVSDQTRGGRSSGRRRSARSARGCRLTASRPPARLRPTARSSACACRRAASPSESPSIRASSPTRSSP